MLIKLETKSARVKGLSFHPRRKWLLASLHNGVIQLWDYGEKTMIDKFEEHKGPVRGLDFHKHQPLFVSGGDDAKIKVWNYKSRRCLFTLDAHEDYIRTTYFHPKRPWILSASDDQSIRIWNWQSRSRVAVLTGHTHYVMCAQFHPSQELILSASIDQTLRLWDISELRAKHAADPSSKDETSSGLPVVLSKTGYSVESKEAHNSEINWCCFHPDPSKQLCLSSSDDNYIKVWKLDNRNGMREVDTLRGHYNNVNCAIFHPRKDIVLSGAEDRSLRVWDLEKRTAISTHRRDVDRYWALAAHPKENLFAGGHDTGLVLFKLERERPAFTVVGEAILFIRGKQLWEYFMSTNEGPRALGYLKPKTEITHHYHKISCYSYDSTKQNQILVTVRSTTVDKSVCDVYTMPNRGAADEAHRSQGLTGIFFGAGKYAVLDKSRNVIFKFNGREVKSKVTIQADEIYSAGAGRLFVKFSETISLWDLKTSTVIGSVKVDAKQVVMSACKNFVACLCSNKILICDGNLNVLSTIHEQRKIKSAAWEESGVLIYNTPVHVKYALTDGETTTIVSVEQTLYIMAVINNRVYCIDRNGDIKKIGVDGREFKFKQAVLRNNRSAILASLREIGTLTRAEISFLVKKGYPDLALKFVDDDQTKFPLALKALDIDAALDAANRIKDKKCWEQLADAALKAGHVRAAERAYKQLKQPYKLAMLYLVSEQKNKMLDARVLAKELGDTSTEFIISLLVKDFSQCVKIMSRCGHDNLAYTCAVNHGLYDQALQISKGLSKEQLSHLPPLEEARKKSSSLNSLIPTINNVTFPEPPPIEEEPKFEEPDLGDNVSGDDVATNEPVSDEDVDWGDVEEEKPPEEEPVVEEEVYQLEDLLDEEEEDED